jgi:hypothetical protein
MPTPDAIHNQHLLGFNQQVIDQALAVVATHGVAGAPAYAGPVGAHMRHVIEHYEALLDAVCTRQVNYDARPRDRALEATPELAGHRLHALRQRLGHWTPDLLDMSVQVLGQGGTVGDFNFRVLSSIGRELAFVAGHAVHHFALLAAHCQQHGIPTPAHFGKAPSTVANEMAVSRAHPSVANQGLPAAAPLMLA